MMNKNEIQCLLKQAGELCLQRAVRFTQQRKEVLSLIAQQNKAISAYELLELLKQDNPTAKPPTIYRALDFLLEQGFIHRIESNNSYILCHHFDHPFHTSALFICYKCGQVIEKENEIIKNTLLNLAKEKNFKLQQCIIEAHGICAQCELQ